MLIKLSEFSGVVIELDEAVPPIHSARNMDAAIDRALDMPEAEARQRQQAMYRRVSDCDIQAWTDDYAAASRLRRRRRVAAPVFRPR